MTRPQELLRVLSENLQTSANVRNVYGEPVTVQGRTIIPVARIGYGLGAGGGGVGSKADGENAPGGGGGGGGVGAVPVGIVEVTPEGTRFLRFGSSRRLAFALGLGLLLGALAGRRLSRR